MNQASNTSLRPGGWIKVQEVKELNHDGLLYHYPDGSTHFVSREALRKDIFPTK